MFNTQSGTSSVANCHYRRISTSLCIRMRERGTWPMHNYGKVIKCYGMLRSQPRNLGFFSFLLSRVWCTKCARETRCAADKSCNFLKIWVIRSARNRLCLQMCARARAFSVLTIFNMRPSERVYTRRGILRSCLSRRRSDDSRIERFQQRFNAVVCMSLLFDEPNRLDGDFNEEGKTFWYRAIWVVFLDFEIQNL